MAVYCPLYYLSQVKSRALWQIIIQKSWDYIFGHQLRFHRMQLRKRFLTYVSKADVLGSTTVLGTLKNALLRKRKKRISSFFNIRKNNNIMGLLVKLLFRRFQLKMCYVKKVTFQERQKTDLCQNY